MPNPPSKPDLLKFHRPSPNPSSLRARVRKADIPERKPVEKKALQNLLYYKTPKHPFVFPRSRCAAVLVALFVGRMGDLYVLLSKRASTLRSYAGDTSLPGGKVDPTDRDIVECARREGYEEIGLPIDPHRVPLLCILEPFLARTALLVIPVVVIVLDNSLRPVLNQSEVQTLFSHPLASFLSSTPPFPAETELDEVPYHTYDDYIWEGSSSTSTPTATATSASTSKTKQRKRKGRRGTKLEIDMNLRPDFGVSSNTDRESESTSEWDDVDDTRYGWEESGSGTGSAPRMVRMHRFLTGREAGGIKPVFGLTASILLRVAQIAYPQITPDFELSPPNSPSWKERVAWSVYTRPEFRKAYEEERLRVDWEEVRKVAGIKGDDAGDGERKGKGKERMRMSSKL